MKDSSQPAKHRRYNAAFIQVEAGVGYSLADGYRLAPATFTRPEVTALLTAEKLAARLTADPTAQALQTAMPKL